MAQMWHQLIGYYSLDLSSPWSDRRRQLRRIQIHYFSNPEASTCGSLDSPFFDAPSMQGQIAAIVCTSTKNASLTSRSTISSVLGGYLPSGNMFGNSRNRNAMNFGMSCECTRYVVN
jgi:hypothetical protein